jgi:anti-sigma-K factor RskA
MADDRDELLALGAAGALTPEEAAELEALLARDPEAAAEYAAMLEDAAVLAESVAEAPPPGLRARVLEAIAGEPQGDAVATPTPAAAPLPPPAPPHPGHVAEVVPIHRRKWWIPATAVAAAIVVVGGALLVTRDADAPTDEDVMAQVLDDDAAVTVELAGETGSLRLVKSDDHDATVLVGDGVAAPAENEVLQLWAIEAGQPASMDVFRPDDDGHVAVVMEGTAAEGVLYAVTVEPEGGSEQPTTEPIYGPA